MNTIQSKWSGLEEPLSMVHSEEELQDLKKIFFLGAAAKLSLQSESFSSVTSEAAMKGLIDGWQQELQVMFGIQTSTIDAQIRT